MNEPDFISRVLRYAKVHGWRVFQGEAMTVNIPLTAVELEILLAFLPAYLAPVNLADLIEKLRRARESLDKAEVKPCQCCGGTLWWIGEDPAVKLPCLGCQEGRDAEKLKAAAAKWSRATVAASRRRADGGPERSEG